MIPDTVKEIKNNAFSYCVNIDEIEIPNSVIVWEGVYLLIAEN